MEDEKGVGKKGKNGKSKYGSEMDLFGTSGDNDTPLLRLVVEDGPTVEMLFSSVDERLKWESMFFEARGNSYKYKAPTPKAKRGLTDSIVDLFLSKSKSSADVSTSSSSSNLAVEENATAKKERGCCSCF